MTVLEVLQSTTDYFKKRRIESARLNAEQLLAHVLTRKRIELYLEFERVLTEAELAPLRELVKRRGQGEPLQHLLGTVEFCGKTFACDKRALVPRPETEELVEIVKSIIENRESRILDVGTGSGVIAITLAQHFPGAAIQAVDISPDALALARENAERLGVADRIHFVHADLLAGATGPFEAVVANLPYVARTDRATLAREVLHDPEVALFGGDRGDELVRRLVEETPAQLCPGGLLALEVGLGQAEALTAFLREKNYHDIESKTDYSGIPRFIFARYG
jgi:release factor glutamine methyltransferase